MAPSDPCHVLKVLALLSFRERCPNFGANKNAGFFSIIKVGNYLAVSDPYVIMSILSPFPDYAIILPLFFLLGKLVAVAGAKIGPKTVTH